MNWNFTRLCGTTLLASLIGLWVVGCATNNKNISIPTGIATQVGQFRKGMSRAQVDEIIPPPTNNFGVSTSGFVSERRELAPGYRVQLDFRVKHDLERRMSGDDILINEPRMVLVETKANWLGEHKWKSITLP